MVDDPRSPIISALLETETYNFDGPQDHDKPDRKYAKDTDYEDPLDMDRIERDLHKLEALENDAKDIQGTLGAILHKIEDEVLT